jgi:hypothetical protein
MTLADSHACGIPRLVVRLADYQQPYEMIGTRHRLRCRTCDGVAYMPTPALPLCTDASTYVDLHRPASACIKFNLENSVHMHIFHITAVRRAANSVVCRSTVFASSNGDAIYPARGLTPRTR